MNVIAAPKPIQLRVRTTIYQWTVNLRFERDTTLSAIHDFIKSATSQLVGFEDVQIMLVPVIEGYGPVDIVMKVNWPPTEQQREQLDKIKQLFSPQYVASAWGLIIEPWYSSHDKDFPNERNPFFEDDFAASIDMGRSVQQIFDRYSGAVSLHGVSYVLNLGPGQHELDITDGLLSELGLKSLRFTAHHVTSLLRFRTIASGLPDVNELNELVDRLCAKLRIHRNHRRVYYDPRFFKQR